MRPGTLFGAIFIWLVFSGGRFTAPFLEEVATFSEPLIGLTFGLEVFFGTMLSSFGAMKADQLESEYPRKGRIICLILLLTTATFFFQLHAVIMYYCTKSAITLHIIVRIVYSVNMTLMFPILDGISLSYLQEINADDSDYGKERKYGKGTMSINQELLHDYIDVHMKHWSQ